MPFAESFKHFVDMGSFKLTDSELTFEQLIQINRYLHDAADGSQFYLKNVTLTVIISEAPKAEEQVEVGVLGCF